MYVFIYVFHASWLNDTDLKFSTHTTLDHILKWGLVFFEKVNLTAAHLEKLPRHVDFPHVSSIALFFFWSIAQEPSVSQLGKENFEVKVAVEVYLIGWFLKIMFKWKFSCIN